MEKRALLDRLAPAEDRLPLARVLDKMEQAQQRNIPCHTDFLTPQQQSLAGEMLRLAGASAESYDLWGGYEGAERKVLLFLPDWQDALTARQESPLRCLRAAFRPEDRLTHRDFLGSLMGLGITREKLGDLLVSEDRCDLVVLDTVADFLLQNWSGAGRGHLTLSPLAPDQLQIPTANREEIRGTVSSLRLDAVASTAFRMARGKAADLIESGRVQVNWRECVKPDKLLTAGDTVSARGLGKFTLTAVGGLTRKGRTSIVVERY